jgi:predicted membrane metal-binding protein
MEFLDMEAERHVVMLWRRVTGGKVQFTGLLGVAQIIIGWLWTCLHLTYGLATMELRIFAPGWEYWRRVHFFGFWVSFALIVFCNVVNLLFQSGRRPATITKMIDEPVSTKTQQKVSGTEGKARQVSVLEEVDELTVAADKTASKANELINTIPIASTE